LSATQQGIVRTSQESETTRRIEFVLMIEDGGVFCRSNRVTILIQHNETCRPCGFPITNTPGCTSIQIAFSDDMWLDPDGLSGFAGTGAVLEAAGLADKVVHASFGANFVSNPTPSYYQAAQLSASYLPMFGVDPSVIQDIYANRAQATQHLAVAMASASYCNPFVMLVAGPYHFTHDALTLARLLNPDSIRHISHVSHSTWNNLFGLLTLINVLTDFAEATFYQIPDGNNTGFNHYRGMEFMVGDEELEHVRNLSILASTFSPWALWDWSDAILAWFLAEGYAPTVQNIADRFANPTNPM